MTKKQFDIAKSLVEGIRDEKKVGANTAERVGAALMAIVELLDGATLEELQQLFLSKQSPDQASGLITFIDGIIANRMSRMIGGLSVGDAVDSLSNGSGIIMENGRIQCDSIEVRQNLSSQSTSINYATAMNGDYYFSGSASVESIETDASGHYVLHLQEQAGRVCPFAPDDILFGTINNLSQGGSDYHTSWLYIVAIDGWTVTAELYLDQDIDGGSNHPPCPQMTLIHRGNRTDIDRQSCWYISSKEGLLLWLSGVTSPKLEKKHYAMFFGLPRSTAFMTDVMGFQNLPINPNQPYLFAKGAIIQDLLKIDYEGMLSVYENYRGQWSADTAANDSTYYRRTESYVDVVYHDGARWQYNSDDRNNNPPSQDNTAWLVLQAKPLDGAQGPIVRFGGAYTPGIDYPFNDTLCVYVRVTIEGHDYYYLRKNKGAAYPIADPITSHDDPRWDIYWRYDPVESHILATKIDATEIDVESLWAEIVKAKRVMTGSLRVVDEDDKEIAGVNSEAGVPGVTYPFWSGLKSSPNFTVDKDGHATMKSGRIAAFDVNGNYLGTAYNSNQGMFLYPEMIGFNNFDNPLYPNLDRQAVMGATSSYGYNFLARFRSVYDSSGYNFYPNTGITVDVRGSSYSNSAMNGNGDLTLNGAVTGSKVKVLTLVSNTMTHTDPALDGLQYIVYNDYDSAGLALPSAGAMERLLHISSGTDFATKLTVIGAASTNKSIKVYARGTVLTSTIYPVMYHGDGGQIDTRSVGKGEVYEFYLVRRNGNYEAYLHHSD